jgi:phosphatidate cytidylyltransferase
MPTFFGLLFVSFLLQYFVRILQVGGSENGNSFMGFGLFFALWVVIVAKFSDIGALLIGKAIGRTKMAPSISPGKTIEGLLGGFAASAGIGALLPWLLQEKITDVVFFGDWIFTPSQGALWAILLALSAVIGDLIASVLKRLATMKDSGGAIPGIGGLFDLTDSLILAAPTGYFILFFLQR